MPHPTPSEVKRRCAAALMLAVLLMGCAPEVEPENAGPRSAPARQAQAPVNSPEVIGEVNLPLAPEPVKPHVELTPLAAAVPPVAPVPVKPPVEITPGVVVNLPPRAGSGAADDEQKLVIRLLISDNPTDNLEALNGALVRWVATKDELPERIDQLVMESFLPMLPMDPLGRMFAIDRAAKRIVLVRK